MKPRGRSMTQGRRTVGNAVLSEINFFQHLHKTMSESQGLFGSNVDISCLTGLTTQVLQVQQSMSFMGLTSIPLHRTHLCCELFWTARVRCPARVTEKQRGLDPRCSFLLCGPADAAAASSTKLPACAEICPASFFSTNHRSPQQKPWGERHTS